VISNDFFSTFSELANVKINSETDGISLLPLLKNSNAKLNRNTLYWHYPHYHGTGLGPQGAVREGKYKLIEWFEKSIVGEKNAYELYDLENDPNEQYDLSDSLKNVSLRLSNLLKTLRKDVGAQKMSVN
jgi:arylsulfatase A-like enzyme